MQLLLPTLLSCAAPAVDTNSLGCRRSGSATAALRCAEAVTGKPRHRELHLRSPLHPSLLLSDRVLQPKDGGPPYSIEVADSRDRNQLKAQCSYSELPERIGGLVEAARVGLRGLREGLEPIRDFGKTFLARGLGHPRIHVGILIGFAMYCGFQVE
jgi:hypothetical protein